MQPIIGITTGGRYERDVVSVHYDAFYTVASLYVDAVRRAGGLPLLLPPGEPHWREALAAVDAVLVTGGADIDPAHYKGNANHGCLTVIDPDRDESDIALTRYLVEARRWPVLFVCRGMQVLNVALGGTLHEHIPDVYPVDMHRNAEGTWNVHDISITADSLLAGVVGHTSVRTYSGHHQAVKDVAPGLKVVATAPDGVVEALEIPGHRWLVAVQWHPEVSAATDPSQQAIFNGLVQAARSTVPVAGD